MSRWNLNLNFRNMRFAGLRLVLLISMLTVVGCMTTSRPSRELMPTPLALSLGLSHPGSECLDSLTESLVPVYVISGRNVEPESGQLDPFGSKRSHTPTLGIAKVQIGKGLTKDELYEETIKACDKKKALVEFEKIELNETPIEIDPWHVKDDLIRHRENPWVQALNRQLNESEQRNVCIFCSWIQH